MMGYEEGNLIECMRAHYAFRRDGSVICLEEGELLIIVKLDYVATVLRIDTSEIALISLLEIPPSLDSVWMNMPSFKRVCS